MKKPILAIIAISTVSLHGAVPATIISDNFDDLTVGSITRTNGKLRGDESGATYLANGSDFAGTTFEAVDASAVGGNFSGKALAINFAIFNRALYIPFPDPGWKVGDKVKVTFDFAYIADMTDNKTSLWMTMQSQGSNLATTDFDRFDPVFTDDSGHSLKLAEKTAGVLSETTGQYGFTNARMHSQSANFYDGPGGLLPFLAGTNPVNVSFELERIQDAYVEPLDPDNLLDGTMLSIYIDGVLIDSIPDPTALVSAAGTYNAFVLVARGPGMIDNLTITHTPGPVIPVGVAIDLTGVPDVDVTFESVAGQTYQLEKSITGLSVSGFEPVGSPVLSVSGGPLSLQDTNAQPAAGEKVFYRVSATN